MIMKGYPVLKKDIFFAHITTPDRTIIKTRNTTTGKDYRLNKASVALLTLCTGSNSIQDIIVELSKKFDEPVLEITPKINAILKMLQQKNVILINSTYSEPRNTLKTITAKYPLERAQIEITNECNLFCVHCFNDSGVSLPDELNTKEILKIIDTLSSLGVHFLTLSGGEPFVHPDIFTIITHARNAPMSVFIITNGTLLTREIIQKLQNLGISGLSISLDSMSEQHVKKFRRKNGTLKKTLQGIAMAKKAGIHVDISMSVSQLTKDIIPLLKYLKEQNISKIDIAPVIFSGREITGIPISPEEYYEVLIQGLTYMKKEFPEALPEYTPRDNPCGIGLDRIGIKADGSILPCPGCVKEMSIGNVRDDNIKKLWETNEFLKKLRTMRVETDFHCQKCEYIPWCGGCIAITFSYNKTICCRNPYICSIIKAYDDVVGFY